MHDVVIALQSAGCERCLNLGEVKPRLGHCDSGTDIDARGDLGGKRLRRQVSPGVE